MSKYEKFIFKRYEFNRADRRLELYYGYDEALEFCETYNFDFAFTDYDETALDRALQLLFFVAGVSYYKMYLAPVIEVRAGQIDRPTADFLSRTYQNGLGEFFYLNQLDPRTPVNFPVNSGLLPALNVAGEGQMVGLGGGKDSLVSVELLRGQPKVATWSLNHRSQLEPLVERVGLPHLWVDRQWDSQIQELNAQDALNGHVPISAIFACVGTVVALLSGYRDVVVSNENSASEPTMHYQDLAINHQYSKSLDYEKDYQSLLRNTFGDSLRYYSLLRPFSELRIAEMFAHSAFEKYKDVFSSCNRAYTQNQHHMSWCGECAKCAFAFLILTPFIDRAAVENIWGGKNLLLDPALETTYKQLLGTQGDKPFDCVGEVKESRAAMRLCQQIYPELNKYEFEIPATYDFRALSEASVPPEISDLLSQKT